MSIRSLIRGTLGEGQPSSDVIRRLKELARERHRIEIVPMNEVAAAEGRIFSVIERVERDCIIIARPSGPGAHRPLIRFGGYTVLVEDDEAEFSADVKVLARVALASGGGSSLHCYKLSMPSAFRRVERRRDERILFGGDLHCEVTIRALGRATPIFGTFVDLSPTGASIKARHSVTLLEGAAINVEATLAEPIGDLNAVGELVRVDPPRDQGDPGGPVLRVRFLEPLEAVKAALADRNRRRG